MPPSAPPLEIRSVHDAVTVADLAATPQCWGVPIEGASQYLLDDYGKQVWFRGVAAFPRFNLLPAVYRPVDGRIPRETSLTVEMEARVEGVHFTREPFQALCTFQHYGLPTRLLDWSESALVALYFVVSDEAAVEEDGALHALHTSRLNQMSQRTMGVARLLAEETTQADIRARAAGATTLRALVQTTRASRPAGSYDFRTPAGVVHCNPLEVLHKFATHSQLSEVEELLAPALVNGLRFPVAVLPRRRNPRVRLQHGAFVVFGGKYYRAEDRTISPSDHLIPEPVTIEALGADAEAVGVPILKTWVVPAGCKGKIRSTLERLGVHRAALFPEPEHQAAYLRQRWQ